MLSVAEASERILAEIKTLDVETVPLRQALGRVLAEDVSATVTMPPWSNSSMDGYALRSADITPVMSGEPVKLRVIGTVAAGEFASRALKRGEAMRIMTGAPIPEGADSVIRKEDTDGGATKVEIRDARDVWKNIRPAGEDFQRGDVLAKRGAPIKAALIGVLASCSAISGSAIPGRIAVLTPVACRHQFSAAAAVVTMWCSRFSSPRSALPAR